MSSFSQTPDKPQPFGYKVSWFALRTSDPAAVADALELPDATPANWASGLAAACPDPGSPERWMFVSPPVNGWVLAVGSWLPYPTVETHHDIGAKFDALFSRLMTRFDDVQYFGSYRVSGFCAWARALKGAPVRCFSYNDGEVLMNSGDQTPEEAKLRLVDLSGLSPSAAADRLFGVAEDLEAEEERLVATGLSMQEANAKVLKEKGRPLPEEDDVVDLAGLWSIDPTRLPDQGHAPGLGLAVPLPENMRQ